MTGERGRGVVLYTLAALILVSGVAWWWRAAPRRPGDDRLTVWRLRTEQLLPEAGAQDLANTVELTGEAGHDEVVDVGRGEFLISVVCAGADGSRVRVSLAPGDSGRGLRCFGPRAPEIFSAGLFGRLHLHVAVESPGPVVFRYTVQRSAG